MSRLLQSLCSQGYGNWDSIRFATKLKWSHKDLAHASRAIILQLVCWANLDTDRALFDDYWKNIDIPKSNKKSKWGYEDLQGIEDFFNKNRDELDALLQTTEKSSGIVHIISVESEAKKKLEGIGGICAILRYKLE